MLTTWLDPLVDLVLPRRCIGCGRAVAPLCCDCAPPGEVLMVEGMRCPVVAAGPYDDALRTALLAYKERGRRDLVVPLAALLAGAARRLPTQPRGPTWLVAVPSQHAASAARGGDHLRRLVRHAAPRIGLPFAPSTLALARVVRDSAGLGASERAVNLDGAMRATPGGGRGAVVVDDIVTTGATLREARRALRAAGWVVHGAAVVAATPRRVPGPPLAAPRRSV